jgi:hypothetical protein
MGDVVVCMCEELLPIVGLQGLHKDEGWPPRGRQEGDTLIGKTKKKLRWS